MLPTLETGGRGFVGRHGEDRLATRRNQERACRIRKPRELHEQQINDLDYAARPC